MTCSLVTEVSGSPAGVHAWDVFEGGSVWSSPHRNSEPLRGETKIGSAHCQRQCG